MNIDYPLIIKAFGALFAILNPFIVLPIFLALTADFQVSEQRRLAIKVTIYTIALCAVILFVGNRIIDFFGITVDEFRIAGGLVLGGMALSMLNGANIASHHGSEAEKDHLAQMDAMAFYPLTFPMIVGPATIATIIIYSSQAKTLATLAGIGTVVLAIIAMLFVVLYFAWLFSKALSNTMRVVMTRLMGMILLAIAVDMATAGLRSVLPGLA